MQTYSLDPEVEILAKLLYKINPELDYNGGSYGFDYASHRGYFYARLAIKQATTVLESMGSEGRHKTGYNTPKGIVKKIPTYQVSDDGWTGNDIGSTW
jgi:hypothetical protein